MLVGCASDSSDPVPDAGVLDGAPVIERFEVAPAAGLGAGGGEVVLSWSVSDADVVRIEPGIGAIDGTEASVAITESIVFTLTAENERGRAEASAVAFVGPTENPDFDLTGRSVSDQIDDALAAGTIDEITALQYEVFALHGDARLPPEYDAIGPMHGTAILFELLERFESLSAAVQEEMRPFVFPIDDPQSWYAIRSASSQKGSSDGDDGFPDLPPMEGDLLIADGRVRLQWQASFNDGDELFVRTVVAQALTRSYTELTELMGRAPLGDGEDPSIYPVYVIGNPRTQAMGWVTPTSETPDGWKSHMTIDIFRITARSSVTDELHWLPSDLVAFVVAHELFHSIGAVFGLEEPFGAFAHWLHESTATWAAHYVYPALNWEHRYTEDFLRGADLSLDDLQDREDKREYGSYLFHLFVSERAGGPEQIRRFWEESEKHAALSAINEALGDELVERWADFAAINWNAGPVRLHAQWDDLNEGVSSQPDAIHAVDMALEGAPFATIPLAIEDPGVRSLSAQYHHLTFDDPNVRTILLSNGFNYELGAGVPADLIVEHDGNAFYVVNEVFTEIRARNTRARLLVKSQGSWTGPYDLTLVPFVAFCQDLPEERVEELVLIYANGNFEADERDPIEARGMEPTVLVSNMACGRWSGSARGTDTGTPAPGTSDYSLLDVTEVFLNDLVFSRDPIPIEELVTGSSTTNLGQYLFSAFVGSSYRFDLVRADADWTKNYSTSTPSQSCEGGGQISLDETQLFGGLWTFNHFLPTDPNYRSHWIDIRPEVSLEYEVVCEEGLGGVNTDNFSLDNFDDESFPVENDGVLIQGRTESRTQAGVADRREVWTWDLAAGVP